MNVNEMYVLKTARIQRGVSRAVALSAMSYWRTKQLVQVLNNKHEVPVSVNQRSLVHSGCAYHSPLNKTKGIPS